MRVGNFVVMVPEARERDSGHAVLSHGQQYTLRLENKWHDRSCDAEVTIDGKAMGGFRVGPHESIVIERPPNEQGKFTFYRSASEQAAVSGVDAVASDSRGLISVKFRLEVRREAVHKVRPMRMFRGAVGVEYTSARCLNSEGDQASMKSLDSGITGLSGHSDQQFVTVANLNYDPLEEVTVHIRLVCGDNVRPLTAVTAMSNVVPAPVGK